MLKVSASGGLPQLYVSGAQPAVQQLVVADEQLWWSVLDPNSHVRRAPSAGSSVTATELAFQTGRIDALAVEGVGASAVVYWVNRDASPVDNKSGLWRKAGVATPEPLVAGGQMRSLAVGPDGLYVADVTAGIGRAAKAGPTALTEVVAPTAVGGSLHGVAVAEGKLYWLAFNAGQLEVHRSGLDGSQARVLGRVTAVSGAYWAAPLGPAQLTVDGGYVYFTDPGTLTGDLQDDNLSGVTGAADGAIYRLPE